MEFPAALIVALPLLKKAALLIRSDVIRSPRCSTTSVPRDFSRPAVAGGEAAEESGLDAGSATARAIASAGTAAKVTRDGGEAWGSIASGRLSGGLSAAV